MFKRTTKAKYWEALEVLPPAYQDAKGFLLGEPETHRTCTVTGKMSPTYAAYMQIGDRYYASVSSMTIAEYKAYKAD
jgi:hypothetical protein